MRDAVNDSQKKGCEMIYRGLLSTPNELIHVSRLEFVDGPQNRGGTHQVYDRP